MTIIITVDAKKAISYFNNIIKKAPKTFNHAARDMAKDCRKGARYRLTTRRHQKSRKGNLLWESLEIIKRGKSTWQVHQNSAIAPYGWIIEEGITGKHFVVAPGLGQWGEGYARPGGSIPKSGGYHFMRDAVRSTQRRAKRISTKHVKELIKGG